MTTLEKLEAAVKNAGLRVGKPVLQAIDYIGDADIPTWTREIQDRGLVAPQTSDLMLIKHIAPMIFGTSSAQLPDDHLLDEETPPQSMTVDARIEPAHSSSTTQTRPPATTPPPAPPSSPASTPTAPVETPSVPPPQPQGPSVAQFSTTPAPPVATLGQVRFEKSRDGGWTLTWDPFQETQQTVVYLLVGGATETDLPTQEGRLAATLNTKITLPGTPRFVSIFAYTGPSAHQAQTQPGRLIAMGERVPEVEIIRHNAGARSIILQWANPVDVTRNKVFRSAANKPLSLRFNPDEEVDLETTPLGRGMENGREVWSFTDSDLTPGTRYEYRIHAVVDLPNGGTRESRGVMVGLVTTEQLTPVTELFVQPIPVVSATQAPIISLIWKIPDSGDVVLVHSINDPNAEILAPGPTPKPLASLDGLGDRVLQKPDDFKGGFAKISRLELPEPDFSKAKNGLVTHCFTAVTLGQTGFVVGKTVSVPMVAAVGVVTLVDRVEWQLIRLRWPLGAAYVEVEASRGQPRYPGDVEGKQVVEHRMVTRDEFSRVGGVMLRGLRGSPATIRIWGVCPSGNQSDKAQNYGGTAATIEYEGHRLMRYMVRTSIDGMRRRAEHQLVLEREGDWPDHEVLMLAGASRCPLTAASDKLAPDLARIGVVDVSRDTLQEGVPTLVSMQPLDGEGLNPPFLRLLSKPTQDADARPMLAWKTPPEVRAEAAGMTTHGSVCPECFAELPPNQRLFVCTGACPEADDHQRVAKLAQAGAKIRRLTILEATPGPRGQGFAPLDTSVVCGGCGRTTSQVVCPTCHAKLPPAWSDTDLLTVSVAGTKGSGKSVYVWSLLPYLRDNLIKQMGGGMQPAANSASARSKMEEISRLTTSWTYPDATPWLTQNPELRLPLLFNVGSILHTDPGRLRALSFFDTAGEMLEDPTGAMDASDILAHSDLVIMMLDMRQIDIVRDVLAIQDKPSDVSPSALLTNLLTAIGKPARLPRLAVVLNQFDLVHRAAHLDGKVAEILNCGSAVFQDPYALEENQDQLYLPNDGGLVDAECRQFLAYAGQGGFVRQVETYPGRAQFFAVSAVGGDPRDRVVPEDGISPFRVADPIRWAMSEQWAMGSGRGR